MEYSYTLGDNPEAVITNEIVDNNQDDDDHKKDGFDFIDDGSSGMIQLLFLEFFFPYVCSSLYRRVPRFYFCMMSERLGSIGIENMT